MIKKTFGSLYWKISGLFFALLVIIGITYVYITIAYSNKYFDEINQNLNRNTARNIVENSTPFYNGNVIKPALDEMFHHVLAINPSLEVYLIDTTGKIIAWFPPEKQIVLTKVNLKPVLQFINDSTSTSIKGDDPLNKNVQKAFSASRLTMNNMLYAYIYVVLQGQQYHKESNLLFGNYIMQVSARTMLIALLVTLLAGLLIIRIITRNYSKIISVMQQFRQGDLAARIKVQSTGDEKQLAQIFNEMADILTSNIDKLKEVENLRRELIANVSHDLRTPIAIIRGYLETLQIKEDSITVEDRKKYINTVSESAVKLENMVNELFELSKLEANQVKPKKEPFMISELLSDINNKYQLIAKSKNIQFQTELSKELRPVLGDISLIERVMQNLIDNAIKFTPQGGTIILKSIAKSKKEVEIIVQDNGCGIPEQERDQIFSRYYKASNFTDINNSTGLGLAITKKILDLHQAKLILSSQENKGTSFIFQLPFYN